MMKKVILSATLVIVSASVWAQSNAPAAKADTTQPKPAVATPVVAQPAQPAAKADTAQAKPAAAKQYKFGFLDYRALFESLPEYAAAQKSLADIKAKYDTETQHNEESFKRMYLEFLQGQKDFPQTIMLKRQKELQQAMEEGVKFRNQVADLLSKAQQDLERPILARIDSAITLVGKERGYDVILNTSEKTFSFISKTTGEDVTELVRQKLATIKP